MREEGKDVKMGFGILMLLCCELSKVIPGAYFTIHGVNGNVSLSYYDASVRQTYWSGERHETFFGPRHKKPVTK